MDTRVRQYFRSTFRSSPQTPLGIADLKAHVQWLVCREVCLPGKAYLGLNLNPVPKASSDTNKLIDAAVLAEPVKPPASVKVGVTATRGMLTLNVVTGKKEVSAEYYPLDDDSIRNAAEQKIEPTADGVRLVTERADISDTLPKELKGVLKLSDGRVYTFRCACRTRNSEHASGGNEPGFLSRLRRSCGGNHPESDAVCFPGTFPQSTRSCRKRRGEQDGAATAWTAFTVGILCSFWIIVGALLTLRALGKQAGWGFQLQSPGFVVAMACLLFFMALSLAGMFDLGLTLTSAGGSLARKERLYRIILYRSPCNGGGNSLHGTTHGSRHWVCIVSHALVTFTVFTALALGLALPYLALTFVPGWANKLPRPGRWMETLKQLTSVPLFLTVIWLAGSTAV